MRTSVTWINDYLDRPATADEQAELLTAAGLNFDGRDTADNGEVWQEIETTSNRGDCLCHLGLAREICALSARTLKEPAADAKATGPAASSIVKVQNLSHAACPRYTARVIQGVKVGPSPEWLQRRLRAIGQVPRNNLVDCTNFVQFEFGQPTHVFDLDKLEGRTIIVREATAGERMLPLGEGAAEVALRPGDLVIADAKRPVAIAGVKGGAATAVTESTTNILLEAATFDPAAVRRASRGLRIASDSSYRFERGVHPAEIDRAADRLAALILETAGGTLCAGTVEAGAPTPAPRTVELRADRVSALLGTAVPSEEIVRALTALGFNPVARGNAITCTVPPRRLDIEREVDLIEEVCRIRGLDRVPIRETIPLRVAPIQPAVIAQRAVKDALAGLGFVEAVTHTLMSAKHAQPFLRAGQSLLCVEGERAGGTPYLRPSVLPSLLEVRARNADAGARQIRLFEAAHTFSGAQPGTPPRERNTVALLIDEPAQDTFRWLRGACERVVRILAGANAEVQCSAVADQDRAPYYSAEAAIAVAGAPLGSLGLLRPQTLAAFGLEGTFAAAELELGALYERYPPDARAESLPSFPSIDRDLSVIVEDRVPWQELEIVVRGARMAMFERLEFVGTYRGKQVGSGRKSVTMRLSFRAKDRTLRKEEVDAPIHDLCQQLTSKVRAEIRA